MKTSPDASAFRPARGGPVILLAALLSAMCLSAGAQHPSPTVGHQIPVDVDIPSGHMGNPIAFFDDFSWKMFLSLNWPAIDDQRGAADTAKGLGDSAAATVWETWKADHEIFQPNGQRPSDWDSFAAASPCAELPVDAAGRAKVLASSGDVATAISHFNQAGFGSVEMGTLIARNRTYTRYEIRVNRAEFDFIRGPDADPTKHLYLKSNLPAAGADPLVFPFGAIEIKAAWREFKLPEEQSLLARYYTREAVLVDPPGPTCRRATIGLVGLHIVARTPSRPEWIWSTFEHIDNLGDAPGGASPTYFDPSGPANPNDPSVNKLEQAVNAQNPPKANPSPTQVIRLKPIHASTEQTNSLYQGHSAVAPTVWANYRLVMTQWPTDPAADEAEFKQRFHDPYPAGAGTPFPGDAPGSGTAISNSTMETTAAFQKQFSCMNCHFRPKPRGNTEFVWFLSLRAFDANEDGNREDRLAMERLSAELLHAADEGRDEP